jgi:hypothetical protein
VEWLSLGGRYTQDEFWMQTPHTYSLEVEAYQIRLAREHNERAWLAYYTAMLSKTNKRITLQSLLARSRTTLDTQLISLARWVKATGGKVIRNG